MRSFFERRWSDIHITQETVRDPACIAALGEIWEGAVRATHHFLSPEAILQIKAYVPQAVGFYQHLGFQVYRRTPLDEEGNPYPLLYLRRP